MTTRVQSRVESILLAVFTVFVFSSTFSITISQIALELSLACFVVLAISERYQPFSGPLRWFYLAVGLYLFWMFLSAMFSGMPLKSLFHGREEWLFSIIPLIILLVRDEGRLNHLVGALALGVILVALYSAYLLAFGEQTFRVAGNFSHALTYGNYVATAALFLLAYVLIDPGRMTRLQRWLIAGGGMAGVVGTIISNSRGSILSLLAGLVLFLFFLRKKRRWLGAAILVSTVALVILSDPLSIRFSPTDDRSGIERHWGTYWQGSRRFIWEHSLQIIGKHPVLGVGVGNFSSAYKEAVGPGLKTYYSFGHAHNDFLNVAVQAGIPGGLFFAALWLSALLYFWFGYRRAGPGSAARRASAAALLGSLVFLGSSMTEATFADEEVRALLMFVWAIGLSEWYNRSGKPKTAPTDSTVT